jgi:four helix bundle protein
MVFSHEKLDVYRAAIQYTSWSFLIGKRLSGLHRHARDQLLRASQSMPLNIAEGNGKATEADRRHFFEIARGSALECAAIQDVLAACGAIGMEENCRAKELLDRIVAMLTKIGGRGYAVKEEAEHYGRFSESESVSQSQSLSAI